MDKHPLNIFPAMLPEDYIRLKNDIEENGYDVSYPIWFYEGQILDGWNREKACTELHIEPVYAEFIGSTMDAIEFVMRSNKRRNLTSSQWATIAVEADGIINKIRHEAEERMLAGKPNPTEQIQQGGFGESAQMVANLFNTNSKYVYEAQKLKDEKPELFEAVKRGEKTITEVKNEEKITERKKQIEDIKLKIESENITVTGKYDVIVIDPPWKYGREYNPEGSRVASPYPEMSFEDLSNIELPIKNDCVLWLWTTHAFLSDAIRLMKIWGFEYKAVLIWDKEKMGMGHWLRMQCEFCLLGIKGNPLWIATDLRDIIKEPRREHSRKPETFYRMIEEKFTGRYLDYFSRNRFSDKWECYGAETEKF
jgi:N6-adenosine-specific RNA methylase IME4